MKTIENFLFNKMVKAIEDRDEKELQYLIVKQEAEKLKAAYNAYIEAENCRNLTDESVGEGTSIYCGDEDRAEFLIQALGELGLNADCEIYTIDGEYFVGVIL